MARLPFSLSSKTQAWGYRPNIPSDPYHKGLDFGVSAGTAVACAAGGIVADVGRSSAYNYFKEVDHGRDAQGKRWWTRYHMLGSLDGPGKGATVLEGQTIGISGPRYGVSTGPHHHFEVHTDDTSLHTANYNTSVNPETYFSRLPNGLAAPIPEEEKMKSILVSTPQASSSTLVDWWVMNLQDRTYWHVANQSQLDFARNTGQVVIVGDKQAPAILAGLREI